MARNRRRSTQTRRIGWMVTMPEDVGPGDLLPWGVVRERTWGGPIGIDAWRIIVKGRHRPVWLQPKRGVICRRAFVRGESAEVLGVIGTDPKRATELTARVRAYILRGTRGRRAL